MGLARIQGSDNARVRAAKRWSVYIAGQPVARDPLRDRGFDLDALDAAMTAAAAAMVQATTTRRVEVRAVKAHQVELDASVATCAAFLKRLRIGLSLFPDQPWASDLLPHTVLPRTRPQCQAQMVDVLRLLDADGARAALHPSYATDGAAAYAAHQAATQAYDRAKSQLRAAQKRAKAQSRELYTRMTAVLRAWDAAMEEEPTLVPLPLVDLRTDQAKRRRGAAGDAGREDGAIGGDDGATDRDDEATDGDDEAISADDEATDRDDEAICGDVEATDADVGAIRDADGAIQTADGAIHVHVHVNIDPNGSDTNQNGSDINPNGSDISRDGSDSA